MPERVQLRRTKGWRKPAGAIVVSRPSKWGNAFVVGSPVTLTGCDADGLMYSTGSLPLTLDMAIEAYRDLVVGRMDPFGSEHPDDLAYCQEWREALAKLRGHDLACWCPLGCGYRLPTPRLCKACERRRDAKAAVVTHPRITANHDGGQHEWDLSEDQRAELYAFLASCGIDVTKVLVAAFTWDLVDMPLLRVERFVIDERGETVLTADGNDVVRETVDVPVRGPLPSWWHPSAVTE